MTKDEALRLALEALESGIKTQANGVVWIEYDCELVEQAITAIKAALEANEFNPDWDTQAVLVEEIQRMAKRIEELEAKDEPFEYWNAVEGWVKIDEVRDHFDSVGCGTIYKTSGEDRVPLYTTPPQRKPLTLEQLRKHWKASKVFDMTYAEIDIADYVLIARDVEALHGIKGEA